MKAPLLFYFDFASPYAWFALPEAQRLAARHERDLALRPILLWALFKAQGVTPPLDLPARKAYLLADIERSAAFHGRKLHMPLRLGFSTHVAARFFHGAQKAKPDVAAALAEDLLAACFADGRDIAALETLQDVAVRHGFDADRTAALAADPANRAMLAECVDEALAAGVIGSPFMILDGEGFFGADRLPQLAWRLGQG